ncbi:protein PHYLLO, chloroplastic-like [Eucalyptus grandis]|uniref:protein PHYLLO, chloroplastic-like n=1 Tax=Eucalyptus grandis TaxID=71139 RepID=UPI00192EEB26|nr:protein PHYLLO, chloroplastic-like [Eucalyptus grandis]
MDTNNEAISGTARCISIDLPGHGNSVGQSHATEEAAEKPRLSIEIIADVLCNALQQKIVLFGYSMGARILLYMTLKFTDKIKGATIISGSPGLKIASARKVRCAKDDNRAQILITSHMAYQSFSILGMKESCGRA